jgi:ferritin-like metal-binding protein YciE
MQNNNQSITTLHDLLICDYRRFASAEVELKTSLLQWMSQAGSLMLKAILQKYLDYSNEHLVKLEEVFTANEISSLSCSNRVMLSFIQEINEKLSCCVDAEVKDACLLAGVQGINHFKISMYGTAAAFANALGMEKAAKVFHEAEINEKQIDDRLSQLAEHEINIRAKAPFVLP